MKKRLILVIIIQIILSLFLAACSGKEPVVDLVAQGVAATLTKQAWDEEMEAARQTDEAVVEEPEPALPEPASPEPATPEPATPEPIVHEMIPGEPTELSNTFVTDFNSIDNAHQGFTYGDQYLINRFERPFTVEMKEYRGYLDLILANMKVNLPWFYIDIYLADVLPEQSEALYSIVLDLDEDNRGDIIIQALMPEGSDWTVDGVWILKDSNEDVGGIQPLISDPPDENLTGFDTVIFEEGRGADPDLAWVRRNPADETSIQIVFKQSIPGGGGFLWSVWADEGLNDPGLFDYNDRFIFEDAGSPFPDHEYHPIQAVYLVDSTCISWYGFDPEGDELGLCQMHIEERPENGSNGSNGSKVCYFVKPPAPVVRCLPTCYASCPDIPADWWCEGCKLP
jgi:hypothetical protein